MELIEISRLNIIFELQYSYVNLSTNFNNFENFLVLFDFLSWQFKLLNLVCTNILSNWLMRL